MLTTGIQNLPKPLARAQAACHDGTARLAPASAGRLARRVEYLAWSVRFVLDDPDAPGKPTCRSPFELCVMGRMTLSFARRAGQHGSSAQPVQMVLRSRP